MVSLQRAASRPRETLRPLIARTTRIPKEDVLRFLADRVGMPRFYYRSRGFALAGAGIAAEVRATGPKRFEAVREKSDRALAAMGAEYQPGVPKDVGPVWMGGFSFEEETAGPDATAFPSARFILPEWQLRVQADGTYRTHIAPAGAPETSLASRRTNPKPSVPTWHSDVDEHEWSRRVRSALQRIRNGDAEKVVLARSVRTELLTEPDLAAILGRLQSLTPQSTLFLMEPEPGHAWLGASPELLLRRSQGRLETAALAGS
ncbi:MAG TPA: chorismate-binding protein, partial [Candidatus Thermoplasmatota archaeon]